MSTAVLSVGQNPTKKSLTARYARRPKVEPPIPQPIKHIPHHPPRINPALIVPQEQHRQRHARRSRAQRERHPQAHGHEHPAQPAGGADGDAGGGEGPPWFVRGVLRGAPREALVGHAELQEVQPDPARCEEDVAGGPVGRGDRAEDRLECSVSEGHWMGLWVRAYHRDEDCLEVGFGEEVERVHEGYYIGSCVLECLCDHTLR